MGIKGRPVSSLEEARATSIDFDGSIFYFPDLANHRIYTKQINLDGTSTLNIYEYKDVPDQSYVTRGEFNEALRQLREALTNCGPIGTPSQADPQSGSPQLKF